MASRVRLMQTVARRSLLNRLKGGASVVIQSHAHSTSTQAAVFQQSPPLPPSSDDLIGLEDKFSAHK